MTRETKVGLVVTASFLSLIGGVLAVKYIQNRPDAATKSAEQKQVAQAGAKAGDQIPAPPLTNNPETPTTATGEPPGKLPIGSDPLSPPPGVTLPAPGGLALPGTTPTVVKIEPKNHHETHDDPNKDDEFSPIKRTGHAEEEKKASTPPPAAPMITLPPVTTTPMPTSPMTSTPPPPLELPKTGASDPPPPLPGVGKIELPAAPTSGPTLSPPDTGTNPATNPKPSIELGPPPMPGPMNDKSKDPPKPKVGDIPGEPQLLPMTKIEPPPPIPMTKPEDKPKLESPKPIDLPKTDNTPPKPIVDLPKPPGDAGSKPTLNLPKPMDAGSKPSLELPKPGADSSKPMIDLSKPPMDLPKPMADLTTPGGNGPKPPADFPKTAGPTPPADLHPGGARLDPSSARPLDNQPEPPVNSYDEEWHYCKQQGETLEAISQKYYFTPKYEQALRQYNVDRNPAPVFQQDKPTLSVGQVVKVPPARILERLYPSSIRGGRSAAPVSPTAASAGNTNPAAALGPVAAKDLGGPREYTVPHEGMTLKDVARDELGGESQWHRIFLLNRWVNPSAPLPTGAKLFLPRAGTQ